MSQRQWIVIIGVWLIVFPFGLPTAWVKVLAALTGLLVIVLAYRIRFKETPRSGGAFTDSMPAQPDRTADAPPAGTKDVA